MLILFAGVMLSAQTSKKVLKADQRIHTFTPSGQVAEDGENVTKVFDLTEKTAIQYYQVKMTLDTVSIPAVTTSPYVTVYLKESMDGATYSNLDTATFYGTAADTSFIFEDITTGLYYPYLAVEVNGADSIVIEVSDVIGNFLDK